MARNTWAAPEAAPSNHPPHEPEPTGTEEHLIASGRTEISAGTIVSTAPRHFRS